MVVADDDETIRLGVAAALRDDSGIEIVGEAGDGDGAVRLVAEHRPHVCLLDVWMPGGGPAAAAAIADVSPETAVVMLTASEDDRDLLDSVRAGARGYLLKTGRPRNLAKVLREVLAGEGAMPGRLTARLMEEVRTGSRRVQAFRARGVELTERQWEVLLHLRDGHSTGEIARRLAVGEATVRSHVSGVLQQLGVATRADALKLLAEAESGSMRP